VRVSEGKLRKKKLPEALILLITVGAMLWVWPIHPFREVTSVRSGDEGHQITEPIQIGESITQYFRMPQDNILSLEFVLTAESGQFGDGELLFELMDAKGNVLNEQVLDCAQIPDYSYQGVILNLRVKRGAVYAYRLTNLSVVQDPPCGVYVTDENMQCLEKARLSMSATDRTDPDSGASDSGNLRNSDLSGEILTRLTANSPLPADNTLAIWGCIALVGFMACELFEQSSRITGFKNMEKKEQQL